VVYVPLIPTQAELELEYSKYIREAPTSQITVQRREEILDSFEPFRQTGKLLDIGCGSGGFLDQAKARGWDTYGTEFTDEAVELCSARGHKMSHGVLSPEHYQPSAFDVLISTEVLEHIANHQEEIPNMARIIRPGGFLYITTPNWNAFSRLLLGEKWTVIHYPEHLVYFTPNTLREMLERAGFRELWSVTSGIGLGRVKQAISGAKGGNVADAIFEERLRESMESNPVMAVLKRLTNGVLDATGRGDALKAGFILANESK